jgi:hypothetical protein
MVACVRLVIKVSLDTSWRHMQGEGIAPLILKLGNRERWVVSFIPRSLYCREKTSEWPLTSRLWAPQQVRALWRREGSTAPAGNWTTTPQSSRLYATHYTHSWLHLPCLWDPRLLRSRLAVPFDVSIENRLCKKKRQGSYIYTWICLRVQQYDYVDHLMHNTGYHNVEGK